MNVLLTTWVSKYTSWPTSIQLLFNNRYYQAYQTDGMPMPLHRQASLRCTHFKNKLFA